MGMFEIMLPLALSLLGLLVWAIVSKGDKPNPYLVDGGRIFYAAGLLVTLFQVETRVFGLSPMASSSLPLLVCLAGIFVWALADNKVLKEAGKIAFAAGLLVTLFACGTKTLHF